MYWSFCSAQTCQILKKVNKIYLKKSFDGGSLSLKYSSVKKDFLGEARAGSGVGAGCGTTENKASSDRLPFRNTGFISVSTGLGDLSMCFRNTSALCIHTYIQDLKRSEKLLATTKHGGEEGRRRKSGKSVTRLPETYNHTYEYIHK